MKKTSGFWLTFQYDLISCTKGPLGNVVSCKKKCVCVALHTYFEEAVVDEGQLEGGDGTMDMTDGAV